MKFICPLITVSDIKRSTDFYENVLNQTVKYDFEQNITFEGDFAIHLVEHFQGLIDHKEIKHGGNNFELYFESNEVEALVEKLKENNVIFVHPIREQPWRQKVVRFYDPDQNIIEVGESMEYLAYRLHKENLPVEKIVEMTYLPFDMVKQSIEKYTNTDNK